MLETTMQEENLQKEMLLKKIGDIAGGFTLIEILVVVSIIGLLASVVLASVMGAEGKGRIAGAEIFSGNLYQTQGWSLSGMWEFNDNWNGTSCSGTTLSDSSLGNNPGTISGATWSTDVPYPQLHCSLYFNGTSDYVDIPYNPDMSFGPAFTFIAWIKPVSLNQYGGDGWTTLMGIYVPFISIVNGKLLFREKVEPDDEQKTICGATPITLDQWHLVAGAFNEQGYMDIYLDGKSDDDLTTTDPACLDDDMPVASRGPYSAAGNTGIGEDFTIGRWAGGGEFFNGYITQVRFYNSALSAADIRNIYAEGIGNALPLATGDQRL